MAIFDNETVEKVGESKWLNGSSFEGEGLVLQIKAVDKIKSQYGAKADNALVERGILEEGEMYRYTFEDTKGNERTFDSHSMPFMVGLNNAEFNFGDFLLIKRTGKLKETRYTAELVEAPVSSKNPEDESLDEVNPLDVWKPHIKKEYTTCGRDY